MADVTKAIAADKHVYCEKPTAINTIDALQLYRFAKQAGLKNGVVQDKLWLPGLLKLKMLRDTGFFGQVLSVRGEFGYWVFEGDAVVAQRPSWNYRKEQGGGIIIDMLCHFRYVLDNLFGEVQAVSCLGATHVVRRWDENGKPYDCTADDSTYATFELQGGIIAHINASWCVRVRRDDLLVLQVDGTKGSAVAGLQNCWFQSSVVTPRATWNPDVENSMNYLDGWQQFSPPEHLGQRIQDPVGVVSPPRRQGRAVPLDALGRRQGCSTGGKGHRIVAEATMGRHSGLGDIDETSGLDHRRRPGY